MVPVEKQIDRKGAREFERTHLARKAFPIRLMRGAARLIPGNRLRNKFYFNLISKPRRLLRQYVMGFYRIELIYTALEEAKTNYKGRFSILEFGTAHGYAFTKMLYAIKYLGMEDRVTAHAFDSFEGMPPPTHEADRDAVVDDTWHKGQFKGDYEELLEYCQRHYPNTYVLHKGFFEESLTPETLIGLEDELPILIWVDCDFYSSARAVFERLIDCIPSGCIVYFDDFELLNFGSRLSGEARVVAEINSGVFGDDMELVLDKSLSLDTSRVYRFIRLGEGPAYEALQGRHSRSLAHRRYLTTNDSILP